MYFRRAFESECNTTEINNQLRYAFGDILINKNSIV